MFLRDLPPRSSLGTLAERIKLWAVPDLRRGARRASSIPDRGVLAVGAAAGLSEAGFSDFAGASDAGCCRWAGFAAVGVAIGARCAERPKYGPSGQGQTRFTGSNLGARRRSATCHPLALGSVASTVRARQLAGAPRWATSPDVFPGSFANNQHGSAGPRGGCRPLLMPDPGGIWQGRPHEWCSTALSAGHRPRITRAAANSPPVALRRNS